MKEKKDNLNLFPVLITQIRKHRKSLLPVQLVSHVSIEIATKKRRRVHFGFGYSLPTYVFFGEINHKIIPMYVPTR